MQLYQPGGTSDCIDASCIRCSAGIAGEAHTAALFSLQLLLAAVTHAFDPRRGSYSWRSSAGLPVVALVLLSLTQVRHRRARRRGHHLLSLRLRRLPLRATAPSSWSWMKLLAPAANSGSRRTDHWDDAFASLLGMAASPRCCQKVHLSYMGIAATFSSRC